MSDFVHGDQADRTESHHLQDEKHQHHDDLESGSPAEIIDDEKEMRGSQIFTSGGMEMNGMQSLDSDSEEVIRARELQQRNTILGHMRAGEKWLDRKMGIETQGIDRIHEEDKRPPSLLNVFFIWWSVTCHVGTLPIGMLGPTWGLSLGQSVAGIVVGTILGALCTAFTGTLGPKVCNTSIRGAGLEKCNLFSWG